MLKTSVKKYEITSELSIDPAHVLNLYIGSGDYREEIGQGDTSEVMVLLGVTSKFPWDADEESILHSVFVDYRTLPAGEFEETNEGNTVTHEVGHHLGLYHPYYNGCNSPGDWVDDTPYQSSGFNTGCPIGRNTCPQPGDDPIHNYMQVTNNDPCIFEFTTGQHERMNIITSEYKPSLGGSTININANLSINADDSWKFFPGASLKFNNGSSLIVNNGGTLNAIGTSNNKITFDFVNKGNYNGIRFYYSSGGILKYCNIKNAYNGIYISTGNANPSIQYCNISNNNYGIYFSLDAHNYVNSVSYNTIENNTYDGIYMDYAGQPQNIDHNTIQYNGRYGIYCSGYSDPDIFFNSIANNSTAGIYLAYYSTPDIHDNNGISNNSIGIKCYYSQTSIYRNGIVGNTTGIFGISSSNINIDDILLSNGVTGLKADYSSTLYASNSAIYGYDDAGDYACYANHNSTMNVLYNCWHALPPTIYTANGGVVNWEPGYICGGMSNFASSGENIDVPSDGIPSSPNDGSYDEELELAFKYIIDKDYENAIAIYHRKFKEVNDLNLKRYILNQLAFCYKKTGRNDFIDFLNTEVRVNLSTSDEQYALTVELENSFLLRERNYINVLENLDFLKSNFAVNDDIYKNTLVGFIHFAKGYSDDILLANSYLDELKSKYPDDEVTLDAEIYLNAYEGSGNYYKSVKNLTEQEQSDKYELLGNYPNPFNPTTNINYNLPYQSSVELVIYDIIGRVVKSFNISSQSAGYQSIIWDGRNEAGNSVSSGIYLYRISIKSMENNESFVKTAKLMLMK